MISWLNPGADPRSIGLEMQGARKVTLTPEGDLVLRTRAGEIRWKKPVLYQEFETERRQVQGGFRLRGKRAGFWIGGYDHSRPLVIDPVLAYATYFGSQFGGASGFESALAVGVDGAGNVCLGGITGSYDLTSTPGVIPSAFGGVRPRTTATSRAMFLLPSSPRRARSPM